MPFILKAASNAVIFDIISPVLSFYVFVHLSTLIHHSKREATKADLSATEADPSSSGDRDRGTRRPRRYITPGESRMSERFRTQPITSAERLESDRYSSGGSLW